MGNDFSLCIAKSCACFHLFVKKHISLPLIASDGVVCLANFCIIRLTIWQAIYSHLFNEDEY